jgi:hypothetical protein
VNRAPMQRDPNAVIGRDGKSQYLFPNPFETNHCVPLAWAHVSGEATAAKAEQIAYRARARGWLSPRGLSSNSRDSHRLDVWAAWAGVRVARVDRLIRDPWHVMQGGDGGYFKPVTHRPTLARFARTHRRGRYVVFVSRHAVAVVDGQVYGLAKPRMVVEAIVTVEPV